MTNPDYRAELQLLFDAAESFTEIALGHHYPWRDALNRAHALLAQPKPPSLKEQALIELGDVYNRDKIDDVTYDTIRRALEALPDV